MGAQGFSPGVTGHGDIARFGVAIHDLNKLLEKLCPSMTLLRSHPVLDTGPGTRLWRLTCPDVQQQRGYYPQRALRLALSPAESTDKCSLQSRVNSCIFLMLF